MPSATPWAPGIHDVTLVEMSAHVCTESAPRGDFGRTGGADGVGAGGVEVGDLVRAEVGMGGRAVSGELDLACEVSVPKEVVPETVRGGLEGDIC